MKSNKFNLDWQITRVRAKLSKKYEDKISIVKNYIETNTTVEALDRVINWVNSFLGDSKYVCEIVMFKEFLNTLNYKQNEIEFNDFSKYDNDIKYKLLIDLLKRNKKWLQNGYRHSQQNEFILNLFNSINDRDLESLYNDYNQSHMDSYYIKNTHKFIY